MTKWVTKKLGEVLTIGNGQDYKHLHNGEIPVFETGGVMTFVDDYLYDGETVCIGRKGTINKPIYFNGKIWTVDTLFYTHSFVDVLPKYVYYAFCCVDWLRFNEATGVPSLSKETIYKIEIPIPALPDGTPDLTEQRRIAGILSSADGAIAASEALIEKYRNIKRGLLATLLQPKEGWKKVKLGECCHDIFSGKNVSRQDFGKYVVYGSTGVIGYTDKYEYDFDAILIARVGANAGLVNKVSGKYDVSDNTLIIRLLGVINLTYLYYLLIQMDLNQFVFGSGQPLVTAGLLKKLEISVPYKNGQPDLAEQRRIAEILSSVDAKIAAEEKVVEKYKGVKKGLMESMMKEK